METFLCENCGVQADIKLVDNKDEDEVLFCPVCGDEYYVYDDADIELDFDE